MRSNKIRIGLMLFGTIGYLAASAYEMYYDYKILKKSTDYLRACTESLESELKEEEERHQLEMKRIEAEGKADSEKAKKEFEEFKKRIVKITEKYNKEVETLS